jgi:hypothetical protein
MDALEKLIAQQEIRDLSARYAMLLDDHDWDALTELWTEDAVWSLGETVFDGRWLFKHREEVGVPHRPGPVSSGPMQITGPTIR